LHFIFIHKGMHETDMNIDKKSLHKTRARPPMSDFRIRLLFNSNENVQNFVNAVIKLIFEKIFNKYFENPVEYTNKQ